MIQEQVIDNKVQIKVLEQRAADPKGASFQASKSKFQFECCQCQSDVKE